MLKKSFSYRIITKTAWYFVFCYICIAFILYHIYAHHRASNSSVSYAYPKSNEAPSVRSPTPKTYTATSSPLVAASPQTVQGDDEELEHIIPPTNISKERRIQWFRRRLPELKILNSTSTSQRFHGRVLELYNNKCSAQFFMIWLSSAKSFGPRELLAVESLFSTNPNGCLAILSSSLDTPRGYAILKPLLDRGFNILAVTPDVPFLVQNTPAEAWLNKLKSGNMDPGSVPLYMNLSDLIRLAVLYKYGGIYLDTDVIILKDVASLRNTIGAQSADAGRWTRLNNAVMAFDINHPLMFEFLHEFSTGFNGSKWGHNSPYLVSRVIKRLGNRPEYNLTIFPPTAFYPVHWSKIPKLFKEPTTAAEAAWVEKRVHDLSNRSYIIHLWNKVTRNVTIENGSVMHKLISTHCITCQNIHNSQAKDAPKEKH